MKLFQSISFAFLLLIATIIYFLQDSSREEQKKSVQSGAAISSLFREKKSGTFITGTGNVIHLLPDDRKGRRHQKFILKLQDGLTVLVSHNIDIAPRVQNLKKGDAVTFRGKYEWNQKGGVIHWTHHDPSGYHPGGWLSVNGRTYK